MKVATYVDGDYSRAVPAVASLYTILDSQRHPTEDAVRFLIAESDVYATFPKLLGELAKLGMIATAKRTKYVSRLMPTLSSVSKSEKEVSVIELLSLT